jgi:hypothetical protein
VNGPAQIEPGACPGGLVIVLFDGDREVARHNLDSPAAAETFGELDAQAALDAGTLGAIGYIAYDGDSGCVLDAGRVS